MAKQETTNRREELEQDEAGRGRTVVQASGGRYAAFGGLFKSWFALTMQGGAEERLI